MSNMASSEPSFLIIGAGVFGVSTAYHLIKTHPHSSVTLVDRDAFDADNRVAASWDWNKAVRADYDDIVYCELALEAQDVFKSDPLWMPYFHETGVYWICRSDYAKDVINNYKKLGRKADISAVPVDEARKMYGGLFDDADYTGVKEVLVNRTSGWAAAGDCLRAVTRKAMEIGVKYVTAEVATLQFDDHGRCFGAKTETGDVLTASNVILCTGAFTPKLLELSAAGSGLTDLRAGPRIVAGGITTGMAQLDNKSYERFASMPVGFQGYTADIGNCLLKVSGSSPKLIAKQAPSLVVFRRPRIRSSSGGDRRYSKTLKKCCPAASFQCPLRNETTPSGRFPVDSRKTFAMPTRCFSGKGGQTGRWRSIASAGRSKHCNDDMAIG